jgi:hypothetical protein
MSRSDQIIAIEDALIAVLDDVVGINGIVFEQELRWGSMLQPYLVLTIEQSPIENVTSRRELWSMRFSVVAVTQTGVARNAGAGKRLAIEASDALLADRTLGGLVKDIKRTAWNPSYNKDIPESNILGAAVTLECWMMD